MPVPVPVPEPNAKRLRAAPPAPLLPRLLLATLYLAGCRPSPPEPTTTPDEPAIDPPAAPPDPCGPTGERLSSLAWVPTEARLTALVELRDDDLEPALATLAQLTRGSEHPLPTDIAFGLAHWDFQVPLVRATLLRAGFEPAQLAAIRLDEVGTAWVFASTCDLDLALDRARTVWNLEVRRTATGALGTAAPDASFAFDVVFLPGDRVALVPAERGADVTRVLTSPAPSTDAPRPGPEVERLEPAPIRAFVHGPALAGEDATAAHRLRITADGLEIE